MNRQFLAWYLEVAKFALGKPLGKPKNNDDMRKQNGTYSQERPMKSLDLRSREAVGVREWMMVMMLMMVPVLNIVLLVRWASADSEQTPAWKVNWARGLLGALAVVITAAALLGVLFFVVMTIRPF